MVVALDSLRSQIQLITVVPFVYVVGLAVVNHVFHPCSSVVDTSVLDCLTAQYQMTSFYSFLPFYWPCHL